MHIAALHINSRRPFQYAWQRQPASGTTIGIYTYNSARCWLAMKSHMVPFSEGSTHRVQEGVQDNRTRRCQEQYTSHQPNITHNDLPCESTAKYQLTNLSSMSSSVLLLVPILPRHQHNTPLWVDTYCSVFYQG